MTEVYILAKSDGQYFKFDYALSDDVGELALLLVALTQAEAKLKKHIDKVTTSIEAQDWMDGEE